MKLNPTISKLPLIALLSLGLACSPLAANASNDNHGWRDHYQQDRGKSHHRSDHHDYGHHKNHGGHDSCRMDYKPGRKIGFFANRPHGHDHHYATTKRRYTDGKYDHHPLFFLGIFSSDQDRYYLD
jgi:hypothetical protein